MLDLFLVRHSITYGNTLGRYIGKRTDEPLTEDGIALVKHRYYPQVQAVFTSPLKRCVQTAALCYPGTPVHTLEELAECDFGALGVQLAGDAYYFGKLYQKPTIGDRIRKIQYEDIRYANNLLYASAGIGVLFFGLIRLMLQIALQIV